VDPHRSQSGCIDAGDPQRILQLPPTVDNRAAEVVKAGGRNPSLAELVRTAGGGADRQHRSDRGRRERRETEQVFPFLVIMRAKTTWRTCYNWTQAMAVLRIHFGDRIPDNT
jgi:hypothetical protein